MITAIIVYYILISIGVCSIYFKLLGEAFNNYFFDRLRKVSNFEYFLSILICPVYVLYMYILYVRSR